MTICMNHMNPKIYTLLLLLLLMRPFAFVWSISMRLVIVLEETGVCCVFQATEEEDRYKTRRTDKLTEKDITSFN